MRVLWIYTDGLRAVQERQMSFDDVDDSFGVWGHRQDSGIGAVHVLYP